MLSPEVLITMYDLDNVFELHDYVCLCIALSQYTILECFFLACLFMLSFREKVSVHPWWEHLSEIVLPSALCFASM